MNVIVEEAIRILEDSARYNPFTITSPNDTHKFLRLKLANKEHEVFAVIFLDNRAYGLGVIFLDKKKRNATALAFIACHSQYAKLHKTLDYTKVKKASPLRFTV